MYNYLPPDSEITKARADQFKWQVQRRLRGEITENEFKPLRLQNGLYMQLHSYMLRVNIPYGSLSDIQLRKLADIADKYDRGYGHFTTRQNIQYNWVDLQDVPVLLDELSSVGMQAIQSSGNCIRNITSDPFAGVAADECCDPRPLCEMLRQWSTFHPEFSFLPRKFKIAVIAADTDRAAMKFHDIGIRIKRDAQSELQYELWVGGGQGRTPMIAKLIFDHVPGAELLAHLESILRVYNEFGRRDNKYKARIKILVDALGQDAFRDRVLEDMAQNTDARLDIADDEFRVLEEAFREELPAPNTAIEAPIHDEAFENWHARNTTTHRLDEYIIVHIPMKLHGLPPGDATSEMMRQLADIAEQFSGGRLMVTHRQNIVLRSVHRASLYTLYRKLHDLQLTEGAFDAPTDLIACPGLDYCSLASARSIGIAQELQERLRDKLDTGRGRIHINISGCINACGHHHVGTIGILGINKLGEEFYQISLGGDSVDDPAIGKILGRALPASEIVGAVENVVDTYHGHRVEDETFNELLKRVGFEPFKEAVYGD